MNRKQSPIEKGKREEKAERKEAMRG
jgi:hypothetical protein